MMRYTVSMNRATWHGVCEFLSCARLRQLYLKNYSNMDRARMYWLGCRINLAVRRHTKHHASGVPVYMRLTGQQIAYIQEAAAIAGATSLPCQVELANTIMRRLQDAGAMD